MVKVNLHKKPENHGKQIAAVATAAAAIGAASAALLTPKSGKQLRGALGRRLKKSSTVTTDVLHRSKQKAEAETKEVKQAASKSKNAAKAKTTTSPKTRTTPARKRSTGSTAKRAS